MNPQSLDTWTDTNISYRFYIFLSTIIVLIHIPIVKRIVHSRQGPRDLVTKERRCWLLLGDNDSKRKEEWEKFETQIRTQKVLNIIVTFLSCAITENGTSQQWEKYLAKIRICDLQNLRCKSQGQNKENGKNKKTHEFQTQKDPTTNNTRYFTIKRWEKQSISDNHRKSHVNDNVSAILHFWMHVLLCLIAFLTKPEPLAMRRIDLCCAKPDQNPNSWLPKSNNVAKCIF